MLILIPDELLVATIELACLVCATFASVVACLFVPRG